MNITQEGVFYKAMKEGKKLEENLTEKDIRDHINDLFNNDKGFKEYQSLTKENKILVHNEIKRQHKKYTDDSQNNDKSNR